MRWLCFAIILSMFFSTLASTTTITIDDENGDPTTGNKISYLPADAWGSSSIPNCLQCQPPPTGLASGETFTGSLFNPHNRPNKTPFNATVKFFGTSVSVSCILSNSLSNPPGNTDMTFVIDGAQAGTFHHFPTGSSGFLPGQTVFNSSTLSLAEHTLVIFNGNFNGGTSLVILDSVTYTSGSPDGQQTMVMPISLTSPPTSSVTAAPATSASATSASEASVKTSHTAAIVGGVVAVLAVLLLLGLAFLYTRHRRNQRDQHRSNVPVSKSFLAPFSDLWASGTPRSQPDMAPVPFPAPAPPVSQPRATARPRRSAPAPSSGSHSRISRISFNPNLLVGRLRRQPPPPIATQPPADPRMATASPALPSGNPLLRQASAQPEALDRVASIQAWQQRTHEMTADQPVVHPLDMSEVDLSSHYDESSVSSPQPPPPPPVPPPVPRSPQPQRRFTVMNN